MTRIPQIIIFSIILFFSLTAYSGSPLQVASAAGNPVVPDGELGELRHGTYPSPPLGDFTHVGVDIVAPCGSDIYAFADGQVKDVIDNKNDKNFDTLSFMVIIEHPKSLFGKPFYTLYLHMQRPPEVNIGDQVYGNSTIIGNVGDTGKTFGCHTHFEIRYFPERFSIWGNIYSHGNQRDSEYFKQNWEDPIKFFKKYPKEVTPNQKQEALSNTVADYNKAIEINPRDAGAYYSRGCAHFDKGEYNRAIADYNMAIEINPRLAVAYFCRGAAYNNKGEYDRAIADCNKAIEINPRLADAYNNRGLAYDNKGEYDRAIADYNKAIEINPRHDAAYKNREIAYKKAERKEAQTPSNEFVKKNGVEAWPSIDDLYANPFVYEGKTIAIFAFFEQMSSATSGVFMKGGDSPMPLVVVSDIPKGLFTASKTRVNLAGKVRGNTEFKIPFFGLVKAPHLKFVDVHFCKDKKCSHNYDD